MRVPDASTRPPKLLEVAANRQVARAFLSGLALYSKGDLNGAMNKFREALKLDSEFFVAAFYLGSCYRRGWKGSRSGGRLAHLARHRKRCTIHLHAAGRCVPAAQGGQSALDILKEAAVLWPQDDQVQLRLGTALALAGPHRRGPSGSRRLPDPASGRPRTDVPRPPGHLPDPRGGPIDQSPAEDKALFDRYARCTRRRRGRRAA